MCPLQRCGQGLCLRPLMRVQDLSPEQGRKRKGSIWRRPPQHRCVPDQTRCRRHFTSETPQFLKGNSHRNTCDCCYSLPIRMSLTSSECRLVECGKAKQNDQTYACSYCGTTRRQISKPVSELPFQEQNFNFFQNTPFHLPDFKILICL